MSSNPVRQERDSDPSVCTGTGQLKTENKNQKKKKPQWVSAYSVYMEEYIVMLQGST